MSGQYRQHMATSASSPPREHLPCAPASQTTTLHQTRLQRLPYSPFRVVELCGGLANGLEALFKAGYAIGQCAWVGIDPDAHIAASQRVVFLKHIFPHLLLHEAV